MINTVTQPASYYDSLHAEYERASQVVYNQLPSDVYQVLTHEWITPIANTIIFSLGIIFAVTTTISFQAICLSGALLVGCTWLIPAMLLSDANYMSITGINPAHFQKIFELEQQYITFPEGVEESSIDITELLVQFDRIADTDSTQCEYGLIDRVEARSKIEALIQNIQDGYCTDGGENFPLLPGAQDKFLKYLRVITYFLSEENTSPTTINEAFRCLIDAESNCEGRYGGEILNAYQIITESVIVQDFPGKICEVLHKARKGIIAELVAQNSDFLDEFIHVHKVNIFTKLLGKIRGIRGWEVVNLWDPYHPYVLSMTPRACFDEKYTKSFIISRTFDWLNGIAGENDAAVRLARECTDLEEVINWFKDNVPEGFDPEERISEEMILQQQESIINERISHDPSMNDQRRVEIREGVTREVAEDACRQSAFLHEFVYNEDMTIIREEAVRYMLVKMQVLSEENSG